MADKMFPIAEVDNLTLAFPAHVSNLMPKYDEIPKEFRYGSNKWNKFFNDMFFSGIKNLKLIPREGVNQNKAIRHIRTIAGSFEPQHEHKEAAIAYLMDQWFSDGSWERAK